MRPNACVKGNGVRRMGNLLCTLSTGNIVYSSRLSPTRVGGLRQRLRYGIVSHALLVLSVFTGHTIADRNGVRMRLTRLHCQSTHLIKLHSSLSQLKKKVKAENPNRGGLRASHHLVQGEVSTLGRRLSRMRGRERLVHSEETIKGLGATTVINCAGTKGSALLGALANTSILSRSGLFTALSPAAHLLALSSKRRLLLASAMNFVHGLPRGLIRTFGDALRRTGCTSCVVRIMSTSGPRTRVRVRVMCRALGRLNTLKGGAVALFGGRSHISKRDFQSLQTSRALGVSTQAKRKLRRFGRLLSRVLTRKRVCVRQLFPCSRTNRVRLVHRCKRLLSRRCARNKVTMGTEIPQRVCPGIAWYWGVCSMPCVMP